MELSHGYWYMVAEPVAERGASREMSANTSIIALSELDEQRWGVRTALASLASPADLASALAFCRSQNVRFLIARIPASEIRLAQTMECDRFTLADTLVYYERVLTKEPVP